MKSNLGIIDRVVRVVLALIFGVLYFTNIITGTIGIILLVLGVVFVFTSFISWCPIYYSLGLSSKKKEAHS